MPTSITLQFPDRNNIEIRGKVSDEQALFFLHHLTNEAERKVLATGDYVGAADLMAERQDHLIKTLGKDKAEKIFYGKLIYELSSNADTRNAIANKILECFRQMPSDMIWKNPDSSYGICLDYKEIANIIFGILEAIKPAPPEEKPEEEKNEEQNESKPLPTSEELKTKVEPEATKATPIKPSDVELKIAELERQLTELKEKESVK